MYHVVEKNNPHAVHCITWSRERGERWIRLNGDSGRFIDKSLSADSFTIVKK